MGTDAPLTDIAEDKLVKFETEVMTIPQFDPENPTMISQGPSMCVFNKNDPQEVLASWLFAQYMLTDEVQIAYAQTEGYVPVTSKAQETAEYQDYMSRGGEDNQLHYEVKIKAAQMLLDNTENTFVTPVFNGSASLRDAAGQLIESTTKSVKRKQEVNEEFFDKLYSETESLYRLDQGTSGIGGSGAAKDLGPLPSTAKFLLGALAGTWVCIIAYIAVQAVKKKKAEKH
jgi:multiple sugar transport system substrate-binding protein